MTKNLKLSTDKSSKPRGRSGGRNSLPPEEKKQQIIFYLPAWLLAGFKNLIPLQADRNFLFKSWVHAYIIAGGESDRLLAQSPVAAELAAYLEATDAPQELRDKLESLVVARLSDEVKLADGVVRTKDGAYII